MATLPPKGRLKVVVVAVDPLERRFLASTLSTAFDVTAVDSFAAAKTLVGSHLPAALVTDLRLGEYNGLHLVLRGKAMRPDMAALVLADDVDEVLRPEATSIGATLAAKPLAPEELVAALCRTLFALPGGEPLVPPYERRVSDRRQVHTATAMDRRTGERRRANGFATMPTSVAT